jgi:hypothetical protein
MIGSMSFHAPVKRAIAIASLGALAALGFAVGPAVADSPSTVTAVTHTMNHPDTTSVAGTCTGISDNGPVWAYDNLSLNYSVVNTAVDAYSVTITAHGSFNAISDPTTGDCYSGHGSVSGWIEYNVTSTTPPDPGNVLKQQIGTTGQWAILADQLFDGNAVFASGGSYFYAYTLVNGAVYTQAG